MTLHILAGLALIAWLYLYFLHGKFWRADARLPRETADIAVWPSVTAVVPARDEAAVIGRAVRSLAEQDYPGSLALIVVDDGSADGTAAAARAAVPDAHVLPADPRPEGWTGKLWALECGLRAAGERAGEKSFIWFTDADIVHAPDELRRLVALALGRDLDLVSLMVRLNCSGAWDRVLIPAFVYFFQMLYPFSRVNDRRARTAAAAGGSMLVRAAALQRIGGLPSIRDALIDDCALARAVKRHGPIWLGLADETCSIRPYAGLAGIWTMVARTAFHQLRYSVPILAGTVFGIVLVYMTPPLIVLLVPLHGDGVAAAMGFVAWMLMTISYIPVLRLYRQPTVAAAGLPFAAAMYLLMTADSARRHWQGRGGEWKSRLHRPGGGSVE